MKRFMFIILGAMLLLGCEKPVEEILTLGRTEYKASANGGKFSFPVTHSADYTLSVEDGASAWIKAEANGAEKNTIIVTVLPNDEYEERAGRLAVKMGSKTEYVSITQAQMDAIVVSGSEYDVDCEEGQIKLVLGSNVPYKVEIKGSWLSLVQSKAFQEEELVFAYTANMNAEPRTATIEFTSGNLAQKVTVTQEGRVMKYVLAYVHENGVGTVPEFNGSLVSGVVSWGDGKSDNYYKGLMHEYASAKEYRVEIEFEAGVDAQTVTFKDIVGVKEIDFSGM